MLGKLIKHEFLSVTRIALPSYIVVIVVAIFGRFLTWLTTRKILFDNMPASFTRIVNLLSELITVVYAVAILAIFVMTLFMMVYRFYKNFYTDEGYLMLTLPVRPTSLVFSKLLNSLVWILLSSIVALLSLWIILGQYDQLKDVFSQVWTSLSDVFEREGDYLREELGVPLWVFGLEIVLFALTYFTRFVLSWYSSVSFGMLISKKHKVLGTILAYIVLSMITNFLTSAYLAVVTMVIPNYAAIIATSAGKALQATLIGYTVLDILYTVALFFITSTMMKRKLNLD